MAKKYVEKAKTDMKKRQAVNWEEKSLPCLLCEEKKCYKWEKQTENNDNTSLHYEELYEMAKQIFKEEKTH